MNMYDIVLRTRYNKRIYNAVMNEDAAEIKRLWPEIDFDFDIKEVKTEAIEFNKIPFGEVMGD